MSLFTAQVHPGRALGFLVLGASLHEIITRLKAEPHRFPRLDLIYEKLSPVKEPVVLNLPINGLRLRFDGPEQRLRLIEVLDFTKSKLTYKDRDVLRPATATTQGVPAENLSGPTFRHIYNRLIGPTFPGEYIAPEDGDETVMGLYVLSYPGMAFSFPIQSSAWAPGKDVVSLLSSSASHPAVSMAIFSGESWPDARENLYTQTLEPLKTFGPFTKTREPVPDEVSLVKIYGEGRLELTRPSGNGPIWIQLGETTPQALVAELGPPDAIYRKNDQPMSIHKNRTYSGRSRSETNERLTDDSTDTDVSSAHTATDESDEEDEEGEAAGNLSGECFYNYFYRGFDVLISTPTTPSNRPPSKRVGGGNAAIDSSPDDASSRLVASKFILHGNVPGSYPFNRHRRCRWEIEYLDVDGEDIVNSEALFNVIENRLHEEWKSIYKDAEEAKSRQRGMVLNRDWGDSPSSSCELLGGWEDSVGGKRTDAAQSSSDDTKGLGNTTLFGFPGLVFEVLKNGTDTPASVAYLKTMVLSLFNTHHGSEMPIRLPKSWSSTLRLPKSSFPHRPLPADQPKYLKASADDLYEWQTRERAAQTPFVLHDGPPYANGALHVGHALNKILKDIICRVNVQQANRRLAGRRVVYVPGWDCHGLPIEIKALEKQRERSSNASTLEATDGTKSDAIGIRKAARKLASKTVDTQMKEFKEWGIMANWGKSWKTMDKTFEIKQLEVFQEMVKRNLIIRRNKPVYWSPSSKTALAEAELEYKDDHESTAAYVEFPIVNWDEELVKTHPETSGRNISAVIWTTTPWTLPANRAIAFRKDLEYSIIRPTACGIGQRELLVVKSRLAEFGKILSKTDEIKAKDNRKENCSNGKPIEPNFGEKSGTADPGFDVVVNSIWGSELRNVEYINSFQDPKSAHPFIHADFVSADSGTGLVHVAPGHGMDDYEVCKQYGLPPDAPVDEFGRFTADAFPGDPELLQGKDVLSTGTQEVLKILKEHGRLINVHKYQHKYPYDWRTKLPVILRATKQWFADVGSVKDDALQSLQDVRFLPESGRSRLEAFVKGRSEWCISRQRAWGVPIPALYEESGEAVLTEATVSHIISVINQRGIDAWWTDTPDDPAWIVPGLSGTYTRGKDTMDVWFDSGTSWTQTSQQADVYIEGTDQHRGWFQSSLLTHTCASERKSAPYKTLITHGFTLDQDGKKMSKSIGNIIAPSEIMDGSLLPTIVANKKQAFAGSNKLGPDALRYWVASCDYTRDVVIGQEVLKSNHAALVKYRTILKMLLGSMHASAQTAPITKLDQIALWHLQKAMADVSSSYAKYEFYKGITLINKWINGDLSAFYLEAIKDRLYCGDGGGVVEEIFHGLLRMLTPIVPRLVEEAWDHRPQWMKEREQIHPFHMTLDQPLTARNTTINGKIAEDIPWLLSANAAIKTAQEAAREKKIIGSSLQSSVILELSDPVTEELFRRYEDELDSIFVVSSVQIGGEVGAKSIASASFDGPGTGKGVVYILPPKEAKCPRCWRWRNITNPNFDLAVAALHLYKGPATHVCKAHDLDLQRTSTVPLQDLSALPAQIQLGLIRLEAAFLVALTPPVFKQLWHCVKNPLVFIFHSLFLQMLLSESTL
ncbi:Isoleucyl-tRNA synthetase [Hyphodiscus hymeniophilus]|uniref:Isoleucine--tRNA ligase, mitochondrial n=1 Tax=Hyphodiscus hymeniophilus TaxID=353542 RepID=A0A9P6VE12_9HELO|nr:Isoleucyl-tRNA synthetase [Hyphodiscus hymeniophilus]